MNFVRVNCQWMELEQLAPSPIRSSTCLENLTNRTEFGSNQRLAATNVHACINPPIGHSFAAQLIYCFWHRNIESKLQTSNQMNRLWRVIPLNDSRLQVDCTRIDISSCSSNNSNNTPGIHWATRQSRRFVKGSIRIRFILNRCCISLSLFKEFKHAIKHLASRWIEAPHTAAKRLSYQRIEQ